MRERYARVVDFVKLHYCLSQRADARFWIDNIWVDNTDPASIPDSLRAKLAMWRARQPHRVDFITDLEMYPPSSWQDVLYGMEWATALHPSATVDAGMTVARQEMRTVALMAQRGQADLAPHRALVQHFCGRDATGRGAKNRAM